MSAAHAATGGGYNDPRYPASPASILVLALKDKMLADQSAGTPVSQATALSLEEALGLSATDISSLQAVANTQGQAAPTLSDIILAVRHKVDPAQSASPTAESQALPATGVRPAGINAWFYTGYVSVAEPSSSPNPYDPPSSDSGYYANLCGPGASTSLTGGWNNNAATYSDAYGSGPQEYLLSLAHSEMVDQHYQNQSGAEVYLTPYNLVVSTVNSQINVNFYENANPSYATWVQHLNTDIDDGSPTIIGVNSDVLAGWAYNTIHFVAINGNQDAVDEFQYYDTAPYSSSGSYSTLGSHVLSRTAVAPGLTADIWEAWTHGEESGRPGDPKNSSGLLVLQRQIA